MGQCLSIQPWILKAYKYTCVIYVLYMCVSVYIYMFPVQSLCAETQNATVWSKEMLID